LTCNLRPVSVETIFLLSFITDSHINPVHPPTPHVNWDHFNFKCLTCAQLIQGRSLYSFYSRIHRLKCVLPVCLVSHRLPGSTICMRNRRNGRLDAWTG
jgi:hypothetical protein